MLAEHPDGGALTLFLPMLPGEDPDRDLKARAAVASTLLAGLELTRNGLVRIGQDIAFGTVLIASFPEVQ